MESMSNVPFYNTTQRWGNKYGDTVLQDGLAKDGLVDVYDKVAMGNFADACATKYNVSREAQDAFAVNSYKKAQMAMENGCFKDEIIPVQVQVGKESFEFEQDEHPRYTSLEKLAQLKPAFIKDGTVTAGNSSGINDGAAAMLLANEAAVKKFGLKPLAKIKSMAVAGVEPAVMGIGPIPATTKALKRANLTVSDLDLIELNEAFASQSIACIHDLGLDLEKVNVNGGSIALGHPLGCSGVRIATTLLHEMKRRKSKYGLATMCVGVGQGAAIIFEEV
jgi:acetyl-CoA C-acetyltransferase